MRMKIKARNEAKGIYCFKISIITFKPTDCLSSTATAAAMVEGEEECQMR